jgi:hypothetical protein
VSPAASGSKEYVAQVPLAEDDDVVKAFSPAS